MDDMDETTIFTKTCQDIRKCIAWGMEISWVVVVVVGLKFCGGGIQGAIDNWHSQRQVDACHAPASTKSYYADPIIKECGMRLDGALRGSSMACATILALPEFEKVRHCWETKSR